MTPPLDSTAAPKPATARRGAAAKPAPVLALDVAIIGAGIAGLGMAIQLRKAGFTRFILFEKDDGVGGTWRDNVYPGSGCDVPSHLYSFSFEPKSDWTKRYAEQPEILRYLEHCTEKYGLIRHLR